MDNITYSGNTRETEGAGLRNVKIRITGEKKSIAWGAENQGAEEDCFFYSDTT